MAVAASRRRLPRLLLAWVALIAIETLGQLALKTAGTHVGAFTLDRAAVAAALASPWLWLALGCYLGQFALWMRILDGSDLSVAFPGTAAVFVVVMLASWVLLGEPVGRDAVLGSATIVAGMLLLGADARRDRQVPAADGTNGNTT